MLVLGDRTDGRAPGAFRHRLRVRYGECDPQGVVFNVNYFAYFDVAVTELFHRGIPGAYSEMESAGADIVVAEAQARYLAPARFDDELDLFVELACLGRTSITVRILVSRGDTTLAEGALRYVFIDRRALHKCPIPAVVRERFTQHRARAFRPPEPPRSA